MIVDDLNYYLVGMMAEDEDTLGQIGKQSLFFSKDTLETIFFVKRLSQPPRSFPEDIVYFSTYAKYFDKYGYDEQWNLSEEERKLAARHFFEDYLILFKPYERFKDNEYAVDMESIDLMKKPPQFREQMEPRYRPVPRFKPQSGMADGASFLNALRQEKCVGKAEGLSHAEEDTPTYVLWYDTAHKDYRIVGGITGHTYSRLEGYRFQSRQLTDIVFREEWFDECLFKEDVVFIPEHVLRAIALDISLQADLPFLTTASAPQRVSNEPLALTETAFLKALIDQSRSQGFLYDKQDLVNFHVAMKSASLVILSGMSGTGKSRLVELYAQAVGAELTMIPVRPAWSDDADLLGFVDTVHNIYRPGDAMLVDTLIAAASKPDRLFIVCFDEMNLARVEHYFSQLFSILENDQASRILQLYNKALESRLYNRDQYPPQVFIGNNLCFVGTVNIDESTHHFSDKVLDRASVIELEMLPFHELKDVINAETPPPGKLQVNLSPDGFHQSASAMLLTDREINFLQELYTLLHDSLGTGFGYRIIRQLNAYLCQLPSNPFLSRAEAFDLQVLQRILTKLRGSEDRLAPLLGQYNSQTGAAENSALAAKMDEYADVSAFDRCRRQILRKAKELRANGYTI